MARVSLAGLHRARDDKLDQIVAAIGAVLGYGANAPSNHSIAERLRQHLEAGERIAERTDLGDDAARLEFMALPLSAAAQEHLDRWPISAMKETIAVPEMPTDRPLRPIP